MECYRHIRYARAGRFEDPVLEPFNGSLEKSDRRAACPQGNSRLGFLMGEREPVEQTEDCFFLSIFTPSCEGSRPVLVWIHGGAYLTGSADEFAYDGSMLAEEGNLVVVTVSYRLGVFGYLHDPDNGIVNLGLKDQLTALRWVKEHISHFGGDPLRVTLAGQSAGGHSVGAIISSCKEPLFSKAIIQSAPLSMSCSRKEAKRTRGRIQGLVHEPLKTADTKALLGAQQAFARLSGSSMPFSPLTPGLYEKPSVNGLKKVLVSWQADDAAPFVAMKLHKEQSFGAWPYRLISRLATKLVFSIPARRYARHLRNHGIETTLLCLDWRPVGSPFGAAHCLELSLLFGSWERWKGCAMLGKTSREEWEQRGKSLRKQWIDFVSL